MNKAFTKIFSLACLFALTAQLLTAQHFLNFKTWKAPDNFSGGFITDLEQDEMGYLWVATSKGLFRFDGHDFHLLQFNKDGAPQLPQANFANIYRDDRGQMWAGTNERGLYLIDPILGTVRNFRTNEKDSSSIRDNRIKMVYQDGQGRTWVGFHKEGFCLFEPEKGACQNYIRPSMLLADRSNDRFINDVLCFHYEAPYLWVGTLIGILRFHPETGELQHFLPHLPEQVENPELLDGNEVAVRQICPDSQGHLWLTSFGGGLLRFDPKTGRSKVFKYTPDTKTDLTIPKLLKKSESQIWLATNQGLASLDCPSGEVTFFNKENFNANLASQPIVQLFYDHKGGLWVVERDQLHYLSKERNLFPSFGLPFEPYMVQQRPGSTEIYASAYLQKDFAIFNTQDSSLQVYTYQPIKEKGINNIHHFQFTKNNMVLAVENTDVFIWDERTLSMRPFIKLPFIGGREGADKALLFSMLDSHDILWAGTKNDGLFRIDPFTKKVDTYRNEDDGDHYPLAYNGYVNNFYEDRKGRIWYGTERGFGRYEYDRDTFINFPYPSYQTGDPDILFKHVYAIAEDLQGRIWIGSNRKGLGYLEEKADGSMSIHAFTTEDGLRSDGIRQILPDRNGDLWLSTEAGLSRLRMSDMTFENYGFEYGFTEFPHLSLADDGSVLASGEQCFYRFQPTDIHPPATQPEVRIWDFSILYKEFPTGKNINYIDHIDLNYEQDNFSFEFGALNFFNPELTEYAYRLDGIDEDWVITSDRNFASYTNVSGGEYTFHLKARTEGGAWGSEKKVQLKMAFPFWEKWWFYSAMATLFGLFLFALYSYRVRQIRMRENLKTEFNKQLAEVEMTALRAQMNPHFLFNCLNSIKLFIVKNDTRAAADYLTKFARLIRLILQNSKHQLVPLSDEIEALRLYIEMEKMRFRNQFVCDIDLPEKLMASPISIPPLLLQPFVENAIWHGLVREDQQNRLRIAVQQEGNRLRCTIEDNGIGRTAAQARKRQNNARRQSLGMAITADRISLTKSLYGIETEVKVHDLVDVNGEAAGTRVELLIPVG